MADFRFADASYSVQRFMETAPDEWSLTARLWLTVLASLVFVTYCRFLVLRFKPGWQRLLLVAPVCLLNYALCATFDFLEDTLAAYGVCFNNLWIMNFKILGLAVNRGPLMLPLSFHQFVAVFCLPVVPTH